MPFTPYRTWQAGEVVTAPMMNQQIRDNGNILRVFERGGTIFAASGITAPATIIVWEAIEACSVTYVKGYRVGGTTLTINARKNGALDHLAAPLSITPADTWVSTTAVQNANYAAGDKLEMMIVSVTGNPTQAAVVIGLGF